MRKYVFIHIGKCGGNYVRSRIQFNSPSVHYVHGYKPPIHDSFVYLSLIRNPLIRLISAFNQSKTVQLWSAEKFHAKTFNCLNFVAEHLYHSDSSPNRVMYEALACRFHVMQSLHFYLAPLIDQIPAQNFLGFLVLDRIEQDILELVQKHPSDIRVVGHSTAAKPERPDQSSSAYLDLSDLALANLSKYLESEYQLVMRLFEEGYLNRAQYLALSRYSAL